MSAGSVTLSLLSFCIVFLCANSQTCIEGWSYHEGSCYSFGHSKVTWGDAQAICKVYNGKLAEIESSDENEFLKNLAKDKQADATFLGGTDIFDEGIWQWASTGKTIYPFTDWHPDEPDNTNGYTGAVQDCLIFFRNFGYKWGDFDCDIVSNFICEVRSTEGTVVG